MLYLAFSAIVADLVLHAIMQTVALASRLRNATTIVKHRAVRRTSTDDVTRLAVSAVVSNSGTRTCAVCATNANSFL